MPFSFCPYCRLPLPYLSGFWLLIILLVLNSGPAYAEWVSIGSTDDGMTAYGDPDTICRKRRDGENVVIVRLSDHAIRGEYTELVEKRSQRV